MISPYELEHEIRMELDALHSRVSQQREQDVSANEIQRGMDRFLVTWSERLIDEEQQQVDLCRHWIEDEHPALDRATIAEERDRSANVKQSNDEMESDIRQRFAEFRYGMMIAIQEIEKGREPSFFDRPSLAPPNDRERTDRRM